jgi:hypothetical protein
MVKHVPYNKILVSEKFLNNIQHDFFIVTISKIIPGPNSGPTSALADCSRLRYQQICVSIAFSLSYHVFVCATSLPLMNEGTQLDLDKFIANMRADAGYRTWYTRTHKKSDDEFYKWFDEEQTPSLRKRVGTVVHGVRDLPSSSYND